MSKSTLVEEDSLAESLLIKLSVSLSKGHLMCKMDKTHVISPNIYGTLPSGFGTELATLLNILGPNLFLKA